MNIDLIYRDDHARGRLDVFTPDPAGSAPVVVVIHGGGWLEGDKQGLHSYATLLNTLGYVAVLPNYRLALTAPHPAQVEDILAVLNWVGAHAAAFGGDSQRLGITGVSAGGHLAALAGLLVSKHPAPHVRLRAVLPICGVFDVQRWLADCPQYLANVRALGGGNPEQQVHTLRDASPVTHVHPHAPPFCLVHGDADTVVPPNQSLLFRDALVAAGIPVDCHMLPGERHGSYGTVAHPGEPLGGAHTFSEFWGRHLRADAPAQRP